MARFVNADLTVRIVGAAACLLVLVLILRRLGGAPTPWLVAGAAAALGAIVLGLVVGRRRRDP